MTILLLGGNGLLGHNVLYEFLQQGYVVHALLRNFSALHADGFPHRENLVLFNGSVLDSSALLLAAKGCDAIVNCAGTTNMSLRHYADYLPVNRDLCSLLVTGMEQSGITRLVHTSTANTIGFGTLASPANETAAMQPPFDRSYYALSKREGESLLQKAAANHPDWHIVIVNPGFMVGSYDTKPSSGALLLAAYKKPLMVVPNGGKSFVHVADVAAAIVHAVMSGCSGSRYLLTGKSLTLKQFYHLQAQVCGYKQWFIPLPNWLLLAVGRMGDLLRLLGVGTQLSTRNVRQLMITEYYDCSRARTDLSMPHTPLSTAIGDFFAWRKKTLGQ